MKMHDEYFEEFNLLLNNWWITKKDNRDDYYKIKSKLTNLREIASKLGCDIICNNKLIKLEKNPLWLDEVYNIPNFDKKIDYVLLMVLIMFLEDKALDEQFILSNFTEYVNNVLANIDGDNKPDWTSFKDRKSLVDVLKYAASIGIIRLRDGNDANFAENIETEALYENTTLSHYLVRNFKFDIFDTTCAQDFIDKELNLLDNKDLKKIMTYRSLFLYPDVYFKDLPIEVLQYLKNMRNNIANDISKYLEGELIFVKDMALVSILENRGMIFPNMNQSITDIVILMCHYLKEYVENNNDPLLPKKEFLTILGNVYLDNKDYFAKKYRDLTKDKFSEVIIEYMKSFKMIKVCDDNILLYPVVFMYDGCYLKDEEESENYEILSFEWEE